MSEAPLVELAALTKRYGTHTAVDGLDLRVQEGTVFGLLGPNGAGKSTTIRMMLSLIRPTYGTIRLFGMDLREQRNQIMRQIGCIIEKPDFYGYLSARRNLELLARMSRLTPSEAALRDVFELVGLTGREHDPVKTYSHGMKQRLGLAQALLHQPRLVILDEPTTGLDPQGIIDLRHLILRLKNEMHKTVILSSHILSEIELIADSMAIVARGKAVAQGRVTDLLSDDDLMVYVEPVNSEKAKQALSESAWNQKIVGAENEALVMRMARQELPALHHFLHERSVDVYALYYRKRLEDYFLKLTKAG
ncbi:MAG: ABC transporter ATP-binding protein [Chitinophagales bacterium]